MQRWIDRELEVVVNVHEVRYEYERQSQVRAALAEELAVLRQFDEFALKGVIAHRGKNGFSRAFSMSPKARMARNASLESMFSISSNSLVAMASQLSEAEERERGISNRGCWKQLSSMGDAKNLLQHTFNYLGEARCKLWEKDIEIKDMKDQLKELVGLLRQSEVRRKEVEKELNHSVAMALATPHAGRLFLFMYFIFIILLLLFSVFNHLSYIWTIQLLQGNTHKHIADDMTGSLSPIPIPAQKQLKYTAGIINGSVRESAAFMDQTRNMVPIGQLSMKKLALVGHGGKLWRWKRSHHQWQLQSNGSGKNLGKFQN